MFGTFSRVTVGTRLFAIVTVMLFGTVAALAESVGLPPAPYTSESSFLAAISPQSLGITTITFNGIAPDASPYFVGEGPTYSTGGVVFTTSDPSGGFDITSPFQFGDAGYDYGTGDVMGIFNSGGSNDALTATLPPNTYAVGFDIGDFDNYDGTGPDDYTVTLSNGNAYNVVAGESPTSGGSGFNFAGFTSPTPITSITVTPPANTNGVSYDNFTYATSINGSIPQYTVQDLGQPADGEVGYFTVYPVGVGDTSAAFGYFYPSAGGQDGFINIPGNGSVDIGNLAASYADSQPAELDSYLLDPNTYNEFGLNPDIAINTSNQLVGQSLNANGYNDAFLWTPGSGMQDLGVLPGSASSGAQTSSASALNEYGEVVGESTYTTLGNIGDGSQSPQHAFVWLPSAQNATNGTMYDLGSLITSDNSSYQGYGDFSVAYGINGFGEAAGVSSTDLGATHAFLWTPAAAYGGTGQMTDLGSLNGSSGASAAYGIDDAGEVAGQTEVAASGTNPYTNLVWKHGFLWSPSTTDGSNGAMTDIGSLSTAFPGSIASCIATGPIVGGDSLVDGLNPAADNPNAATVYYEPGNYYTDHYHGIIYQGGVLTDLGALGIIPDPNTDDYNDPAYTDESLVESVNASGVAVGKSSLVFAGYSGPFGTTQGFVYTNGLMYALGSLLTGADSTGWTIMDAVSVNSSGQILCSATDSSGSLHVLLLTPTTPLTTVPTPTVVETVPSSNVAGNPDFTLAVDGTGFVQGAQVEFNGQELTTKVESSSLVEATVPAADIALAGTYNVTVSNPGNATPSAALSFTVYGPVAQPTITSLSPDSAVAGSPQFTLTINGANFGADTEVNFNNSYLAPSSVAPDGTSLQVTVPAYAIANPAFSSGGLYGAAVVYVVNSPDNSSYDAGGYTGPYALQSNTEAFDITNPAPTITSITPSPVQVGSSNFDITIMGTGFNSSTVPTWSNPNVGAGTTTITNYTVESSTVMIVYVAAGQTTNAAIVPITLTNPAIFGTDGGSATSNWVIGAPAPTITSLSPGSVQAGSSDFTLTINGSNFISNATVQFGSNTLTPSSVMPSGSCLTVTVPAADVAAAGTVPVTVTDPGVAPSNSLTFTIDNPTPYINNLQPDSAAAGGSGFTLTINGGNFASGATVAFGSDTPLTPTSLTAAQITVNIPPADVASIATVPVTVTNPNPNSDPGTFTSLPCDFFVTNGSEQVYVFSTAQSPLSTPGVSPDPLNQGWYSAAVTDDPDEPTFGYHTDGDDNYIVGQTIGSLGDYTYIEEFNDYFIFDLSSLNLAGETILSATLNLQNYNAGSDSNFSDLTLGLWDVSTDAAMLQTGLDSDGQPIDQTTEDSIFADLGGGTSYGTFSVPVNGSSTGTVALSLNSAALSAIAAHAGQSLNTGYFAIGGSLQNITTSDNEYLFGGSSEGNGVSTPQYLTVVVGNTQPTVTGVALNPTTINGGQTSTGTVTISTPAPSGGTTVTLSSDNTAAATAPSSVTVLQGQTTAMFTVTGQNVTSTGQADIIGSIGTSSASAQITVNPPLPTVASVSLNPNSVTGGQSSTGTVTLSGDAPSGGAAVTLSSNNGAASVGGVTVQSGQSSATFNVSTSTVTSTQTANIMASYNGTSASAPLTINPSVAPTQPPVLSAVAVSGAEIDLTWTEASPVTSYTVYRSATTGGPYTQIATNVTTMPYQDMGLTASTPYYYVMTASGPGGTSGYSNEATATTLYNGVELSATAGNGSVALAWTAAFGTGVTYAIYRALEPNGFGTTPYAANLTAETYTDTQVTNGTTYYYEVVTTSGVTPAITSNQAVATPNNPASPAPSSDLQLATSTINSWVGNASQFTVTMTNTGGSPQYLSGAQINSSVAGVSGWLALDSPLQTTPLLPGQSAQATFDLTVPNTATGGTLASPTIVPLTLQVEANATYQRNFNLQLYQNPPTTLQVTVEDTNGNPIPNALVAFDNSANLYQTGSNGQLAQPLPEAAGSLNVYGYADGYLPSEQNTQVVVGAPNTVTVTLASGNALSISNLSVTPITGAQAAAYGVDLDDPENYNIIKFSVQVGVQTQGGVAAFPIGSTNPQPIYSLGGGGSGGGGGGGAPIGYATPVGPNQYVIVYLTIPGELQYLKQFFGVAAIVYNDTPFTIGNVNADLDVPDGLDLPELNGQEQPESESLGNLLPYSSGVGSWIVRGDDPGLYTITGSTDGNLELGGALIPVDSKLAGVVNVQAPVVQFAFTVTPQQVTSGTPFTLGVTVTNNSTFPLEDASIDLTASDLVNCYLPSDQEEEQDLGSIAANGGTATVNYQVIPEVTGKVVSINSYTTTDPDADPDVDVKASLLEAKNETASTLAGQSVQIPALQDATAIGINENVLPLSYVTIGAAQDGITSIDSTATPYATITYAPDSTPTSAFIGIDSFGYTIKDSQGDQASASVTVSVNAPTLGIVSLSPTSVAVGSGNLNLTINGSGFYAGSTVSINGSALGGVVIDSPTEISATVPSALLQTAGPQTVTVTNPGNNLNSSVATLTVTGNPTPYLETVSPNTAIAGSGATTINITGIGFVSGSTIDWNSTPLQTTFLNSNAINGVVPAADLASAGMAQITVVSPSPGGGTAVSMPFTVTASSPKLTVTLTSLSAGTTAQFNVSNTGTGNATNVHVVSGSALYVSGGKAVSVAASSLTQPITTTLGPGASTTASIMLPAIPSGSKTSFEIVVASDQVSTSYSVVETAP